MGSITSFSFSRNLRQALFVYPPPSAPLLHTQEDPLFRFLGREHLIHPLLHLLSLGMQVRSHQSCLKGDDRGAGMRVGTVGRPGTPEQSR